MQKRFIVLALTGVMIIGGSVVQAQQPNSEDKSFLKKDSQGNVAEVELAKLALSKSHDPDVKAFAQRMVSDHEKLAQSSKPLLDRAGLQPSTSLDAEHQKLYNRLKNLSGNEFDKEYVMAMDKDHHEDLKAFRKEASSTKDPMIKGVVQSGAAVIAEHTKMIDDISTKMGMMPAS